MAKRVNVMLQDLPSEPDLFVLEFAVNDVSVFVRSTKGFLKLLQLTREELTQSLSSVS